MVLRVEGPDRTPLAERRATNMVLRGGALLIARLFAGKEGIVPIDTIGVGFAKTPGDAELAGLTAPTGEPVPAAALRTALTADSFTIVADQAGSVQVNIAARFKPTADLDDVTEAGLLAGDTLYNQVIFEPVTLRTGQDVTLFWQIDFPFGH